MVTSLTPQDWQWVTGLVHTGLAFISCVTHYGLICPQGVLLLHHPVAAYEVTLHMRWPCIIMMVTPAIHTQDIHYLWHVTYIFYIWEHSTCVTSKHPLDIHSPPTLRASQLVRHNYHCVLSWQFKCLGLVAMGQWTVLEIHHHHSRESHDQTHPLHTHYHVCCM